MAGREFDIISNYFRPLAHGSGEALGLLDDAAVLSVPEGCELVVTTDAVVGGVHYLETLPPQDIAHKVVGVNLSDLAAMGATPHAVFLAAQFSPDVSEDWLEGFAAGLGEALKPSGAKLLGGDTVTTFGSQAFTITALGHVEQGKALTRGGAQEGDLVLGTGTFGDAALGLALWQGKIMGVLDGHEKHLTRRYARPEPRNVFGAKLSSLGLATACVDVSDGLVQDLGHICGASGVSAVLEWDQINVSDAALSILDAEPQRQREILSGGDDYELVFTALPEHLGAIEDLAERLSLDVCVMGRIEAASVSHPRVQVLDDHGNRVDVGAGGYRHF
ncbi:thiamine-phosphate kinase [Magnetovibrio sp. PR-2]|uniref:thiamine-phosphate kinase n=1 Tax=Magnetovibrio sp. PR-2 TaxID=3120356 RepID=UPI002FCE3215